MSSFRWLSCGSALLLAAALQAQGNYYVNGITGADLPGNGSLAAPWRTIGYALAHVPPQPVSMSATVYVEGNQVYSPTTNGEFFPITPAYNVAIEGTFVGHGRMPVLRPPAGMTAFLFPGNVVFNRNQVTFRYLVVEGGDYALRMGAMPGSRHRPRVQDCTFRDQLVAAIRIDNAGNAINDPRFFQNTFTGPGMGLAMYSTGSSAITQPDVEENRFVDLGGIAIDLEDRSPGGGNVGGIFRSNWFDRCAGGIRIRSAAGAVATNASIRTSRFADLHGYAVEVVLDQPFDPNVTIEQCAMVRCGGGVRLTGTPLPGSYTLTLSRNAIHDCPVGLNVQLFGQGAVTVTCTDNVIQHCGAGIQTLFGSAANPPLQFRLSSHRDRLLDCDHGALLAGDGSGVLTFTSGMVCGHGNAGVWMQTTSPVTLRSMTLADNGIGFYTDRLPAAGSALDHLVFDSNGIDVFAPTGTPIQHSCLSGMTWPGTGNLYTDPELERPFYKLAPTSPCIDAGNPAVALPATDYEGDDRASVSVANGTALPDLGADEYVYAGSARRYGTGGFSWFNVFPRIAAASPTAPIGSVVQVQLSGAVMPVFGTSAVSAFLVFGWRDDSGTLPFDLAPFGLSGSYLWNDFTAVSAVRPVTAGNASQGIPIPNLTKLIGETFTLQWFALMPGQYGWVGSDGLRVTVGR